MTTVQTYNYCERDFKNLYECYFKRLVAHLYAKCGCQCEAEDLAQEAFCKLWKNRAKIETGKAPSYLYTIANNLFIDKTRKLKVRRNYQATIQAHQEVVTPEFVLRMKEHESFIATKIEEMPAKSREVFIMNRIENMTYNEIAENLNLSVKAIEKRMTKALHIFRNIHIATAV